MTLLEKYKKRITIAKIALPLGGVHFIVFGIFMIALPLSVNFAFDKIMIGGILFILTGIGFFIMLPLYIKGVRKNIKKYEAEIDNIKNTGRFG